MKLLTLNIDHRTVQTGTGPPAYNVCVERDAQLNCSYVPVHDPYLVEKPHKFHYCTCALHFLSHRITMPSGVRHFHSGIKIRAIYPICAPCNFIYFYSVSPQPSTFHRKQSKSMQPVPVAETL